MLDFYKLKESEQDTMYALPIYIAILMANADGNIDNSEMKMAIKLSKQVKKYAIRDLEYYYALVNQDYEDKLKFLIHNIPKPIEQREKFLLTKIEQAKSILANAKQNLTEHQGKELLNLEYEIDAERNLKCGGGTAMRVMNFLVWRKSTGIY